MSTSGSSSPLTDNSEAETTTAAAATSTAVRKSKARTESRQLSETDRLRWVDRRDRDAGTVERKTSRKADCCRGRHVL